MTGPFDALTKLNEEIRAGERKLASKVLDRLEAKALKERLVELRAKRCDLEAPDVTVDNLVHATYLQTQQPWRGRKASNNPPGY